MSELMLRALSDAEVEKLHEKTLELLEKVGVYVKHEEAIAVLKKAGARVDEASGRVRFPAAMVRELLALAPSVAVRNGPQRQSPASRRPEPLLPVADPRPVHCRLPRGSAAPGAGRRPPAHDPRRVARSGQQHDAHAVSRKRRPRAGLLLQDHGSVLVPHDQAHGGVSHVGGELPRLDGRDGGHCRGCRAGRRHDAAAEPGDGRHQPAASPRPERRDHEDGHVAVLPDRSRPSVPMAGTTAPYSIAGTVSDRQCRGAAAGLDRAVLQAGPSGVLCASDRR